LYLVAAWAVTAHAAGQEPAAPADPHLGLIDTYCSECHNSTDWAGGVAFDTYTAADVPEDIEVWEATVRKLRGHLMPPPGSKQPTQAEKDQLVNWLETRLDARPATPRAGHVTAQRLNRTEYANAVRSLLGVEIKVEDLLPPEIEMDGFDNIAAVLTVSPTFLDQYIGAARYISRRAVGDPKPKMSKTVHLPGGASSTPMPLGSAGGMAFKHFFPADGEYRLSLLDDLTGGLYTHQSLFRRTIVIFIDGKEVFRADIGGKDDLGLADKLAQEGRDKVMSRFQNIPVHVTSGTHEVVVTAMERARVLSDENIGAGGGFGAAGGGLRLSQGVEVSGPYGETTIGSSPSRDRIFVCYPASAEEERPCAQKIARHLATRAYRRPVNDADVEKLMKFFDAGRREIGHFDGGVQEIVMGTLSSPDFLYRIIAPREGPGPQPLNDLELASRLAFFLWSDLPDEELLQLAVEGRLKDQAVYDAQVLRMLQDRRAQALVDGFAMRWLNVDDLHAVDPDPTIFRGFSEALRNDFSTEIRLFLSEVLLQNRSVLELLDADYTYVNDRLARHYGISGVLGSQFRRVKLDNPVRFGLLGKAAVLLRTSYGDRTSPVLRGAWVLERIMGTPATPPPPGVETNLNPKEGEQATTLRARLEVHRQVKSCNQCHGVIDPLGLALENFDVIGAWRTRESDSRQPIDASTTLPDGTPVNGVVEMRKHLMERPEQFAWAMTQKLLMYATSREIEAHDMPQVRKIVRDAAASNYRFFDLVKGVVNSDAFRLQAEPHDTGGHGTTMARADRD
jgi:mono/diheme cytochrome c family protein